MNNLRKLAIVLLMTLVCLGLVALGASTSLAGTMASHDNFDAGVASTIQNLQSAQVPTNQIIIKYKASADLRGPRAPNGVERLKMLSDAAGVQLTYFREMSGKAHVLRLPERLPLSQVRQITNQLMTIADVEYAEPDAVMQHTLAPNDPRYAEQWHYYETWGINAPAAWDITTGSPNIVVAVIDTGITNHAEFSGRTVPGYDFISSTLISNDGDGRDSDPSDPGDWVPAGYCYTGSPAENSSWHGTHTAGTIGASSNNGLGVAGINWNSKIQAIRVLGRCGGLTSDIVDGMRWAAGLSVPGVPSNANPAKVLNMSLGGSGTCGTTYQDAINEITAAGAVVVVSAGNSNADASGFRPANCNGVITVAATNRSGYRAYYSNYGSVVEISAPGGETTITSNGVLSTLNTGTQGPVADTYAFYQGTSMAAPHVAGVASLLFSLKPSLTPGQVLQILQSTAKPFPAGGTCNTSNCGSGIVNAGAAVQAVTEKVFLPLVLKNYDPSIPTPTPTFTPTPPPSWQVLVSTDFEGDFPGPWRVYDSDGSTNGEYYWGKRSCRPFAGSYSGWAVGAGANGAGLSCGSSYPNNARSVMQYGPFSLVGATAAELRYKVWYNTESGYDYVCHGASINGTDFYGDCWSGNSNGWIDRVFNLSSVPTLGNLLGQPQVWVMLYFQSDYSITYAEGAYVDNIVLRRCPSGATCPPGSSPALSAGGRVVEVPLHITVPKK